MVSLKPDRGFSSLLHVPLYIRQISYYLPTRANRPRHPFRFIVFPVSARRENKNTVEIYMLSLGFGGIREFS
jgi:hypothetical protein